MAVAPVRALVHIASWRRLAAALAVVALAIASIGNVTHRAVVRHVACEHGELVELAAPTGGQSVVLLTSSVSAASVHDHHHCALDGFHSPVIQRSFVCNISNLLTQGVATVVTTAAGRAPLAYAPKTSPPV